MKSGLRGGKPRDMATMSHGGKTSRGAGAAQRGFEYNVYAKGGKVKKYADGGAIRDPETGDYKRDLATGTRQYASFSDWMGDLFGKGKKAPESKPDYSAGAVKRESLPSEEITGAGDRIRQEAMDREEASRKASRGDTELRSASTPRAREDLPTRPSGQQRRMAARMASPSNLPSQVDIEAASPRGRAYASTGAGRQNVPAARQPSLGGVSREDENAVQAILRRRAASRENAYRDYTPDVWASRRLNWPAPETARQTYAKGGTVKKAGGGSCRGMGAAQRGGKYSVR